LEKHGKGCHEIISMKKSFHGRTLMALTATGQTKYQKGFDPLMPGFAYAEFNNFEDVKKKVSEKTCGILIEPIQGEGGIIPAEVKFLQNVRKLCNEKDIVLIFDEVQCGIGRTGKLFAYELFDVKPDVVCLAKGLGGGIPIGAVLAVDDKAEALKPGEHASTFGGNYIACVAANVVLEKLLNGGILENVKKQGEFMKGQLINLKEKYDFVVDVRGSGLIQGLEIDFTSMDVKVKDVVLKCIEKGLLLVGAGENTIRFVPPLIINENQIAEGIEILEGVLNL
jgi:acetylornithine/succinyldiaminopimelate/putrescine aminotransferase